MFKSMVHPILEYASSVWDPHTNVNIQNLNLFKDMQLGFIIIIMALKIQKT